MKGTSLPHAAVREARERLEAEQTAHRRRGFVHDETTRKTWQDAYDAWMNARGEAGDAFAISLGYGPGGWSLDRWLAGHEKVHGKNQRVPAPV